MRHVLGWHVLGYCTLLLVAPVFAQEKPEEKLRPPEPKLEDLTGGGLSAKRRDGPAVHVRLHSGGQLQFKGGDGWTNATLASLGEFLDGARKTHAAKAEEEGKSGYEKIPGAGGISNLFVAIEADPGTPWQHIEWLMTIAAERKYRKLELSNGKLKLLTFLPVDRGVQPAPKDPPPVVTVPVHVIARAEKAAAWGGGMVSQPTEFLYRTGNRQTADLATVVKWIRDGKKAAAGGAVLRGEIQAGNKVPFAQVFDVLKSFVDEGVTSVRFHAQVPVDELRKAERLPYPVKNYETAD